MREVERAFDKLLSMCEDGEITFTIEYVYELVVYTRAKLFCEHKCFNSRMSVRGSNWSKIHGCM